MADKYLTGKRRTGVISYSPTGTPSKGTGTPPESVVTRELALDPLGSKLPIGGMSKKDLERISETEKTTASLIGTAPFQKPSDLLSSTQEPTVEDIRRVLGEYKHLLTEQSIPLTEHSMKMFDAARRKYGTEALAWGENWEEAGKELGFKTDDQLRTLINDIYAVQERKTKGVRDEFWALEGPAFEKTVQNIFQKRRGLVPTTTASDDLAKFKKDVEATQVTPSEATPPTTKQSASELLRQFKQQVAGSPIPEPGRELQYELRPVEKPMTDARPDPFSSKELEERREAQQSIQDLEKVLASLQKNRKGNYKPVTIWDGGPDDKRVVYRGFILDKGEMGDGSVEWTVYDPQSREQVESISTSPRKKDILEDVDALWDEKPVRFRDEPRKIWDDRKGIEVTNPDYNRYEITPSDAVERGKFWRQAFYDWGLIDSVEARPRTIQEGADEFEKIREVSPVVEEVSAELLPKETFDAGLGRQSLFDPELKEGRRLLIMSCCQTKTDDPGEIPALERYAGTLFQTLKKQGIPDDVDVMILSANPEHPLIRINHPLSKYDTRMTKDRQKELLEDDSFTGLLVGTLKGYDDVLLASGKDYRDVVTAGMVQDMDYDHLSQTGGSIGGQRKQLKEWLRRSYGEDPLDEMLDQLQTGKPPSKRQLYGLSLQDFVRDRGMSWFSVESLGLGGDVNRLELEIGRKPGQRKVVREGGMDLDDLAVAAYEAGYFGTVPDWEVSPGINELLELLDQSTRSPVYSELEGDPDMIAWEESISDLDRQLTERGIDLKQSNKAIREQLAEPLVEETYEEIPFETEPTPQGIQTLVEGVEPVTTQDLLEVEAERPLRGGEAEAGPLFDIEGRAQMDLVEEAASPEKPALTPVELRSQINKKTATKLGTGLYNYRGFEIERLGTEEGAEYVRWNILAPEIPGAPQDFVLDPENTFGDAKQVIDKWLASPEKYNSDYIFKFTDITKKATGGFIDKPLYERTL